MRDNNALSSLDYSSTLAAILTKGKNTLVHTRCWERSPSPPEKWCWRV